MARLRSLNALFLLATAVANASNNVLLPRASCDSIAAEGTSCVNFDSATASAFCSMSLTVPTKTKTSLTTQYITIDSTSITHVITTYATPPATTTITEVDTLNSTQLSNATVTITSGKSVFYSTYTAIVTNTETVYTCPTSTIQPLNGGLRGPVRDQRPAEASFSLGGCFWSFVDQHGQDGITDLCSCYGFAAPTQTSYETSTSTVSVITTDTFMEIGTQTITPTITVTRFRTTSATISLTRTITTQVPQYTNATTTTYMTTTTTVTMPSSAPTTGFDIFYYNSTADVTLFARGVNSTSGDGTLITFGGPADTFSLDVQLRLTDRTDDNSFTAKNRQDPFPYLFLDGTADISDVPACTVCDGTLSCNYPGTIGSVFALCDGFLALGPVMSFTTVPECSVIDLKFFALP